jgi:pyruvate,water dikinase
MLTSPSFQERPAPLVDMLRAYARVDGDSPADTLRAQAEERERATDQIRTELSGRAISTALPIVTYAFAVDWLLPRTHAAICYRERARLKQALLYSRCRMIALAIGGELTRRGMIAERDDVFFLTVWELLELAGGAAMLSGSVLETIAVRKAEHARLSATNPPDAFTLDEGAYLDAGVVDDARASADADKELRGVGACGGRVTGRAAVLRHVAEADQLARGDVLVTRQTDPGWGPVFFLISGLVIERGGMLSHGAIIAREFGIPCVVGVRGATEKIQTGATLTVDGDRGVVHVVD